MISLSTSALNTTESVLASPSVVLPFTVRFPVIVTSSGKPIVKVVPEPTVTISFVVPSILNVWLSKSTEPVPVSPAKSKSTLSIYALIDCWVAKASSLSDAISSSSRMVVIPTKVWSGCPISNWFIVAMPLIIISLPLISS